MNDNPLIMVIDDNKNILENLELLLKINSYNVVSVKSAEGALKFLEQEEYLPDLIICDIKMQNMDGYDFFDIFSKNQLWAHIPFIFLSALNKSKEIRKGKGLGVDDYLTKPFNEEELLAVIQGKLKRKKITEEFANEINDEFRKTQMLNPLSKEEQERIILFIVEWNDKLGPQLREYYPHKKTLPFSIDRLGKKLFQCSRLIYGSQKISEPEGLLINLKEIKRTVYLFFDSYPDQDQRSGRNEYMLGIIAPSISYMESTKIKKILRSISDCLKNIEKLNLEKYWEQAVDLLIN
ncbi:MAG: response regulator [Promethearchaeia archaeon]